MESLINNFLIAKSLVHYGDPPPIQVKGNKIEITLDVSVYGNGETETFLIDPRTLKLMTKDLIGFMPDNVVIEYNKRKNNTGR